MEKTSDKIFLLIQVLAILAQFVDIISSNLLGRSWWYITQLTRVQKFRQSTDAGGIFCFQAHLQDRTGYVDIVYSHALALRNGAVIVEVAIVKKRGAQLKYGLELSVP